MAAEVCCDEADAVRQLEAQRARSLTGPRRIARQRFCGGAAVSRSVTALTGNCWI